MQHKLVKIAVFSLIPACFTASVLAQQASTNPPAADAAQLAQEVQKLRAEVAALREQQGGNWLNERRKDEIKAVVQDVLADAKMRGSVAATQPVTAGHNGKNFFLASPDNNFMLTIGGQIQARYVADHRHHAPTIVPGTSPAHVGDDEQGFSIRRMKLCFDGYIGSPQFTYNMLLTTNRDIAGVELEVAKIGYSPNKEWTIAGGRYKDFFLREEIVSDTRQLAADRSLVNSIFTTEYVEGIYVQWQPQEWVRLNGGANDGIRSGSTAGSSAGFLNGGNDFYSDSVDIAFTGRADFKIMGEWKQFDDFAPWSELLTSLFVGTAYHYELAQSGDRQTRGTSTTTGPYDDISMYTIDSSFSTAGLFLYGAAMLQQINTTDKNSRGNLTNWGAVMQASYMVIPDKLQPYVRYEYIDLDTNITGRTNSVQLVTLGNNYFFRRHALKMTTDVIWALDPLTSGNTLGVAGVSGCGLSGAGLMLDSAGERNQLSFRAQVQLLF